MKRLLRRLCVLIFILLLVSGCTNTSPKLEPGVTPPPLDLTPAPVTEAPSPTPEQSSRTAAPTEGQNVDELGNVILSANHFERYIAFTDILVYEENGDTFVDLTAVNSYPRLLLCAVNISFRGETGEEIASGSLQMPDGSFLLALPEGSTRLYARILTDTALTDKSFVLEFDAATGVKPE
ncbi:MAG: hypothetical protein IJM85_00805 [Clostridia bacterium]|nr:hypothetical protein [Clostridia bacterium]